MTTSHISPIQLEQLRRDAKRLARKQGTTHSAALDDVAAKHGFSNWSLLAKHVQAQSVQAQPTAASLGAPTAAPLAPTSPARTRSVLGLRMGASRSELRTILAIVVRFERIVADTVPVDRFSLMMDLEACHCNGCPLDLMALLEATRDVDLVHDVAGIARHLDRETGKLQDCFRPRYAAREQSLTT